MGRVQSYKPTLPPMEHMHYDVKHRQLNEASLEQSPEEDPTR
jgi:hypothetical protein